MNRVSDERLAEMEVEARNYLRDEWGSVIRELRDYRKAVRKYLSAVDAVRGSEEWGAGWDRCRKAADLHKAAEATLRALQERT